MSPLIKAFIVAIVLMSAPTWAATFKTLDGWIAGIDLDKLKPATLGHAFSAPASTRWIEFVKDSRGFRVDEATLAKNIEKRFDRWYSYGINFSGSDVTTLAPGLDFRHHIANAYLVGFVPYSNVDTWVAIYALALSKTYQLDSQQHGKLEIWQTSKESFYYPDGDCEDHAIALADWLIGLNLDARVVLGDANGGHAWVVLLQGSQTYLIESTDKGRAARAPIPLAMSLPGYHPRVMFNRDSYWVNTGTKYTVNYANNAWVKRSTYHHL
jgi:hypothetical protein